MEGTIKERIKLVRNTLNLSQKDISTRIGIARTYWTSLENGNREITGKILMSLIVTFDISADWLLIGSGKMFISEKDRTDYFGMSDQFYLKIVQVIELREKLLGPNPAYDNYLSEIESVIQTISKLTPKAKRESSFERFSKSLHEEFIELFSEYFSLTTLSDRAKKLKTKFEPPRHFVKALKSEL